MSQLPLRAQLATALGRTAATLSRATGRGDGSVIGGRIGLMLDPDLLRKLAAHRKLALVSATNGKTTTTRLIAAALQEPITDPAQLRSVPFIDFGFGGPRRITLRRDSGHYELTPSVRARANNFQVCKQYILQGLGIGVMPTQIICTDELRAGTLVPVLPHWRPDALDVHMIYPFELSFSTLISAFYEVACEIISENIARA